MSTTAALTMPPCILSQKTFGRCTRLLRKSAPTSPSPPALVMSTVFTSPVTLNSNLIFSANIKPTPNKNSVLRRISLCTRLIIRLANDSFLVFHGGSGSTKEEYSTAVSHGVVKVNLDTDLQYAYCAGIRDYMLSKKDYVSSQVGNPDGDDKPNKKYFDPRVWVREGEKSMSKRVKEALDDFKTAGKA